MELKTPSEFGVHHRSARRRGSAGGRKKSATARSVKLSIQVYPEDMRDLEAVASAWEVPLSLLGWALVHEWLQRGRGMPLSLGDARGPLRWVLEKALEDGELGPWLRGEIARACSAAPEG